MRILIVGAGAVGQTYAWHLQRGGCQVDFYVRPARVPDLHGGVVVHPLNRARGPQRLSGYALHSDPATLEAPYDQLWLTVPSDALRGPWLSPLLAAVGSAASVITLQPGPGDAAWLETQVDPARLISGVISFLAWWAPLPGVDRAPGVAWWIPPLTPQPFSGAPDRVGPLVAALRAGGLGARQVEDARAQLAAASALMMPFIAALELSGWRFDQLLTPDPHRLAHAAAGEVRSLAAPGSPAWPHALLGRRRLLRLGLAAARWILPFDLQTYLKAHFTKVGPQTRDLLRRYAEAAEAAGRPAPAVAQLRAALGARVRREDAIADGTG